MARSTFSPDVERLHAERNVERTEDRVIAKPSFDVLMRQTGLKPCRRVRETRAQAYRVEEAVRNSLGVATERSSLDLTHKGERENMELQETLDSRASSARAQMKFVGQKPVVSRGSTFVTLVAKCGCGFEHRDPTSLQPAMNHASETGHTVQYHGEIKTPKVVRYE